MDKTDKIKQEEFPLPRYVQEVLSKHNIYSPPFGGGVRGRGRLGSLSVLALQSHRYPDIDMPYLLNQLTGWQTARTKLPSWAANEDIIYPHICLWNSVRVSILRSIRRSWYHV